jgi:[citrate (pro-3S)-lyase] ligase
MNCNPFTLGHEFLITTASKSVDHLYVFVVEEDLSFFPFADRLELVKQGTKHLDNVTVLPGGEYIISKKTFEAYFYKDELQNSVVNPSYDVELFGNFIAPVLDITVRFAGEEPLDEVTRQYNNVMRLLLPSAGVQFVEIPRRRVFTGEVISASQVRKLLKDKNFDAISKIVPESTLRYLTSNFG